MPECAQWCLLVLRTNILIRHWVGGRKRPPWGASFIQNSRQLWMRCLLCVPKFIWTHQSFESTNLSYLTICEFIPVGLSFGALTFCPLTSCTEKNRVFVDIHPNYRWIQPAVWLHELVLIVWNPLLGSRTQKFDPWRLTRETWGSAIIIQFLLSLAWGNFLRIWEFIKLKPTPGK